MTIRHMKKAKRAKAQITLTFHALGKMSFSRRKRDKKKKGSENFKALIYQMRREKCQNLREQKNLPVCRSLSRFYTSFRSIFEFQERHFSVHNQSNIWYTSTPNWCKRRGTDWRRSFSWSLADHCREKQRLRQDLDRKWRLHRQCTTVEEVEA